MPRATQQIEWMAAKDLYVLTVIALDAGCGSRGLAAAP